MRSNFFFSCSNHQITESAIWSSPPITGNSRIQDRLRFTTLGFLVSGWACVFGSELSNYRISSQFDVRAYNPFCPSLVVLSRPRPLSPCPSPALSCLPAPVLQLTGARLLPLHPTLDAPPVNQNQPDNNSLRVGHAACEECAAI